MLGTLTERSNGSEDKRRLILEAAVRVFARKGYHTCRVGDIAEEAGVAHGLLYHYFRSKDEVLECIFKETWSDIIAAARMVEEIVTGWVLGTLPEGEGELAAAERTVVEIVCGGLAPDRAPATA